MARAVPAVEQDRHSDMKRAIGETKRAALVGLTDSEEGREIRPAICVILAVRETRACSGSRNLDGLGGREWGWDEKERFPQYERLEKNLNWPQRGGGRMFHQRKLYANKLETRERGEERRSVSIWAGGTAGDWAMTFCLNATPLNPELEGKAGVLICRSWCQHRAWHRAYISEQLSRE